MLEKAVCTDLPELLALQKLAYLSEAKLVNDYGIQPLIQTLAELEQEFASGIILKYTQDGKIIGSVRANAIRGVVKIGKLMVHPHCQNQGIGGKLLVHIERHFSEKKFELFTSSLNTKNISLYRKNGYEEFARKFIKENLEMVFLRKSKE